MSCSSNGGSHDSADATADVAADATADDGAHGSAYAGSNPDAAALHGVLWHCECRRLSHPTWVPANRPVRLLVLRIAFARDLQCALPYRFTWERKVRGH